MWLGMFNRTKRIAHPLISSRVTLGLRLTRFSGTAVLQSHTTECLTAAELQPDLAQELLPANPEIRINFWQSKLDSTEQPSQSLKEP